MAARKPEGDEEYWGSSQASRFKQSGVNLFDEKYDLTDAKSFLKAPPFPDEEEEDDDEDTINWDGSAADSRSELHSARYRPQPPSSGSTPFSPAQKGSVTFNARSERVTASPVSSSQQSRPMFTEDRGTTQAAPVSQPSRPMFIDDSDKGLLQEAVGGYPGKSTPSLTEVSKLEAEVNSLKRSLHSAHREKYTQIPPEDTIKRMIVGHPYSLEGYRSKEDKLALIDAAIKYHDGNAVIATVLFLRDTIKTPVFNAALTVRPVASEHYLCYLKAHGDYDKLIDLLGMLGRNEEAAMFKYKQACGVQNADIRLRTLQACHRAHFESDGSIMHEASMVQDHIKLLEVQRPIEASDEAEERKGAVKFKEFPRQSSLLGLPVITTLFYCFFYHHDLAENSYASPLALKKAHKLSEKQYMWSALPAYTKLKMWTQIEALFQTKGWLGGTKLKAPVGFDRIVHCLSTLKAPREVMNKYCRLIDYTELRLQTGVKCGCHEAVIETFANMKDRQQLIAYADRLKQNSQEWFYAKDVLSNSSTKWKN